MAKALLTTSLLLFFVTYFCTSFAYVRRRNVDTNENFYDTFATNSLGISKVIDLNTRALAYKDRVLKKCYIERFYGQELNEVRYLNIYRKPLTREEILRIAGPTIASACYGWLTRVLVEPNNYIQRRRRSNVSANRSRGQSQSQYLSYGKNGNDQTGKAEAEATAEGTKAVVVGSNGMGQAQSQNMPFSCEDCLSSGLPGIGQREQVQYPGQLVSIDQPGQVRYPGQLGPTGPAGQISRPGEVSGGTAGVETGGQIQYPGRPGQVVGPGATSVGVTVGRETGGQIQYPGQPSFTGPPRTPGTGGQIQYPGQPSFIGQPGQVSIPGVTPGGTTAGEQTSGQVQYPGKPSFIGQPGQAPGLGTLTGTTPGGQIQYPGQSSSTGQAGQVTSPGTIYPGSIGQTGTPTQYPGPGFFIGKPGQTTTIGQPSGQIQPGIGYPGSSSMGGMPGQYIQYPITGGTGTFQPGTGGIGQTGQTIQQTGQPQVPGTIFHPQISGTAGQPGYVGSQGTSQFPQTGQIQPGSQVRYPTQTTGQLIGDRYDVTSGVGGAPGSIGGGSGTFAGKVTGNYQSNVGHAGQFSGSFQGEYSAPRGGAEGAAPAEAIGYPGTPGIDGQRPQGPSVAIGAQHIGGGSPVGQTTGYIPGKDTVPGKVMGPGGQVLFPTTTTLQPGAGGQAIISGMPGQSTIPQGSVFQPGIQTVGPGGGQFISSTGQIMRPGQVITPGGQIYTPITAGGLPGTTVYPQGTIFQPGTQTLGPGGQVISFPGHVGPDGYMPTDTTISRQPGQIFSPQGTISPVGGPVVGPGGQVLPGGQVVGPGGQVLPAGQVIGPGGQVLSGGQTVGPGGQVVGPGGQVLPGGQVVGPSGQVVGPGEQVIGPGGQVLTPGSQIFRPGYPTPTGGQVVSPGGQILGRDGQTIASPGQTGQYPGFPGITSPSQVPGQFIQTPGTSLGPGGTYFPGQLVHTTGGQVVEPSGQVIVPDGTYIGVGGGQQVGTGDSRVHSGAIIGKDDSDTQAQSSIQHVHNGTQASASSQGTYQGGTAKSQVSGTYAGDGSFSASAGTNDGLRAAQTQVSGNIDGVLSSAQGMGGKGQSQAQVQLNSETGETASGAQSGGINHGTATQVQAGIKGGMADAQSNGPGRTSSQAQIAFSPPTENVEQDEQGRLFGGGGSASASGGANSGKSQAQINGKYEYGIKYVGSAQAQSANDGIMTGNYSIPKLKPINFNENSKDPFEKVKPVKVTNVREVSTQNGMHIVKIPTTTTSIPDDTYDDEEYDDEEEYIDSAVTQSNKRTRTLVEQQENQNFLDPIVHTEQQHNAFLQKGNTIEPGHIVPGTNGYKIPTGFRGRVTEQNVNAKKIVYAAGANANQRSGSGFVLQPVHSVLQQGRVYPKFYSATKSETGSRNLFTGKKTPSVYYSQTSSCGYFTNSCFYNNGRKICMPRPKTHPDGSPIIC